MEGCTGATSRAVAAVEAQGYTIRTVVPAVFPVSITVHISGVWVQPTLSTHRPRLSHNMFSQQQPRQRHPRCPMSTNATKTPYTGKWNFSHFALFIESVLYAFRKAVMIGEMSILRTITSCGCITSKCDLSRNYAHFRLSRSFNLRVVILYESAYKCAHTRLIQYI